MPFENIILERKEGVAIITLNRPQVLNALSTPLLAELDRAITELENDEETKAVVITGAGEKAFSAGADIHEMASLSEEELEQRLEERGQYQWHLATCQKPTIGAINGLAYGGAALVSSSFDIRIGCQRTRFRFLAATYGRLNSTWTLPLVVGWPKAKELLFTGRVVEAAEAKEIGLLNQLVPADQLLSTALEMGKMITQNDPQMVQGIKELLQAGIGAPWEKMFRNEMAARSGAYKGTPVREGFREFLTRRERKGEG